MSKKSPPSLPKRAYHHGDLKNALLEAAMQIIARKGAHALSLREAAQQAGVSHAAAYRHFENKESLFAELAEQGFRELGGLSRAAIQGHPDDPLAQLQASGEAYVLFGAENPARLQLMFGEAVSEWNAYPGLATASREAFDQLAGIIRRGQQSGAIRKGDVMEIAVAAWSLVHGLALLLAGKRIPNSTVDRTFARKMAKRCTRLLIDGLGAHG